MRCFLASLLVATLASVTRAQPKCATPAQAQQVDCAPAPRGLQLALGVSLAQELRADYGAAPRLALGPELVALGYLALPLRDLYFRPGFRIGYDGLTQPDMPRELHLAERGLHELLEAGLVLDGVVVPALSVGAGLFQRFIALDTTGNTTGTRALDHTEWLGAVYAAFGLGIPIERGLIVLEPFVRVQHMFGDTRSVFRFGLDVTLGL